MIARIWHGYTKPEHADAYEVMLKPELRPGISKTKGYRGSYLLRREAGGEVEFITIMLWDSIDAIGSRRGAGLRNGGHPRGTAQVLVPVRRQIRALRNCICRVKSNLLWVYDVCSKARRVQWQTAVWDVRQRPLGS
jgi:heme-degrading monooxygenase HmoA